MTCRDVVDFLTGYLAQELSPSQRGEFEQHVAVCPPCVRYLDTYQRTVQLGKDACADESALHDIPNDLEKAILAARAAGERK